MNQEIMNEIADAIKNNDMAMIKKLEEEYNVKIKVPGNIPKNEIEKYINDEMNKRKDNMFKF